MGYAGKTKQKYPPPPHIWTPKIVYRFIFFFGKSQQINPRVYFGSQTIHASGVGGGLVVPLLEDGEKIIIIIIIINIISTFIIYIIICDHYY